uniref:Colipase n=1 Tax=Leptobrachium leishanense TaxID=445787 RepID=A0A8C5MVJ5_9ANUR
MQFWLSPSLLLFILSVFRTRPGQDNGELCLQTAQCKSKCCHRDSGVSLARCAPRAAEYQKCSPLHLTGVYYFCQCESGLTCDVDRTIVGTVTNTDFGFCKDPNDVAI